MPLTEVWWVQLQATSNYPQDCAYQSLFLFPQTNLTSLEEARFLFLEYLGQHKANEYTKKKEGVSHTALESFLLEALTHPYLLLLLFVPPLLPNIPPSGAQAAPSSS